MNKRLEKLFTKIAQEELLVETLETRKRDCLDFHDCSVWGIKSALEKAYNEGLEAGKKQATKNQ